MNECPEHEQQKAEGCFIAHIRCSHLGTEWVLEQLESVDRELHNDGKEHLARYAKVIAPDEHIAYFTLNGTWEEAEVALLNGTLYQYGYAQYKERMVRHG